MTPNYTRTVTIYRKIDGAWEKTVLRNCFWKSEIRVVQDGVNAGKANCYTVRIPYGEAGSGFIVSEDDVAVLGECGDVITGRSPDTASEVLIRNKPDAFKVTAFADNTSHPIGKHYRIGG